MLKQLQSQINTQEIRVSSLRTKQRSITGQITLYSVLIYLAYLVYYALGKNYQLEGQTILSWTLKIAIMLVFPTMYVSSLEYTYERVFGMRRSVRWWYTRRIEREIQEKETLKTRLDEKIEELKEKSDYYNTQQLLERYDSKSSSTNPSNTEKLRDQHIPSGENLRQQQQPPPNLRQRGTSNLPIPVLPPPITPSTFAPTPPQPNVPQFHPSAFSPPPSPSLPESPHSKTFLDRVLDLLVGEDENAADHRYALICRHCRAHNGLAPPGERGEEVGYLCGRCGGWNGPEPNKQKSQTTKTEQREKHDNADKESVRMAGRDNEIKDTDGQGEIGEKPQE